MIEHLENPRAVFREFHRLLRPRGTLLLTTPNQESLRSLAALVLRGHFVDFLDGSYPAHITALVRKDFERIAAEAGFARPRFLYTDDGGVPRFPTMKWQTVSFGLLRGRLFSDNVLVLTQRDAAPMLTWHIITGEYPPVIGGVSDYCQLVAEGLAASG